MRYLILFLLPFAAMAEVIVGPDSNYDDPRYGDYNALGVNSSGQITITQLAGEDETNDVIRTEQQFSVCIDDADIVCTDEPAFLHSVWCFGEDAAATAGRVRVKNATTAAGAETTEVWGAEFAAAFFVNTGQILDIVMTTGIVIDFTDTADVKCGVSYR